VLALRELQERFHARVTRPGPVREPCDDLVAPAGGRTPQACLDVYAEMYFCRLHDVLAEQHPTLCAALGARPFRRLVERYLAAHRPDSPSIGEAGARLPELLDGWQAELARLERLHVTLFEAADAPPAALASLAALPPDALCAVPLRLVPAHALYVAGHRLDVTWTDPRVSPPAALTRYVVWRDDVTVRHRVVDDDGEWAALGLASRGTSIAAIGETDPPVSFGPDDLFAWLGRWCDDGLLAAPWPAGR
jgi:hypothetical protein